MSLEGITFLDEVLQKKATKKQKMRFWYIAQKIIFLKVFNGNKFLENFHWNCKGKKIFLWNCKGIEIIFFLNNKNSKMIK